MKGDRMVGCRAMPQRVVLLGSSPHFPQTSSPEGKNDIVSTCIEEYRLPIRLH